MRRTFARHHFATGNGCCAARHQAIPPRLMRAYRLTRYRAAGCEIRIGHRAPNALFTQLQNRTGTLLTAWNPLSRRMPDGWNTRMQRRLRLRLQRAAVLEAEGSLQGWREAMLLVGGQPARAVRLARQFRQCAVVVLRQGARVRLIAILRLSDRCGPMLVQRVT
jgi:hypothetical protein